MNNKTIRCFVAMRFGASDTDLIYERIIKMSVKLITGKSPIRIDRVLHKKDINVKIIEELHKATIVIADLTYARPSVYYEAGFAERLIPVLYTVRRDHLAPNAPEEGAVHFDLKMKPIVPWDITDLKTFKRRFEQRLRYLVSDLEKRRIAPNVNEERSERKFYATPVNKRLESMIRSLTIEARKHGFKKWEERGHLYKVNSEQLYLLSIVASLNIGKTIRQGYFSLLSPEYEVKELLIEKHRKISCVRIGIFICGLSSVPLSTLHKNFSENYAFIENIGLKILRKSYLKTFHFDERGSGKGKQIKFKKRIEINVIVADKIKSYLDYNRRIGLLFCPPKNARFFFG